MNTPWRRHHPCCLPTPFLLVLLLGGLTFAMSRVVTACALCLAGRTLTISAQELVYAGRSVLAVPDVGGKTFRVVEVIKGEHPPGDTITDTVFRADSTAIRSTKPLLLIRDDAWRWWVNFGPIAAEQAGWLRRLAVTKRTTGMNAAEWRDHVAYFLPYLENPEPMVAEIAFAEFASAPYAALRSLKPRLDATAIRKWSDDPALATRQALYTLLLGIAGGAQDAEYLEKSLESAWKSKDSTNLGAELAADLELRGPSRIGWIEERYFVDHDRTMPEIQAALLAMGEQGRATAPYLAGASSMPTGSSSVSMKLWPVSSRKTWQSGSAGNLCRSSPPLSTPAAHSPTRIETGFFTIWCAAGTVTTVWRSPCP